MEKLLTSAEAATMIGCTTNALYQLNHRGILKPIRRRGGRKVYYDPNDIQKYLKGE